MRFKRPASNQQPDNPEQKCGFKGPSRHNRITHREQRDQAEGHENNPFQPCGYSKAQPWRGLKGHYDCRTLLAFLDLARNGCHLVVYSQTPLFHGVNPEQKFYSLQQPRRVSHKAKPANPPAL